MSMGPNMMINNLSTGGEGVWTALADIFNGVRWGFCIFGFRRTRWHYWTFWVLDVGCGFVGANYIGCKMLASRKLV